MLIAVLSIGILIAFGGFGGAEARPKRRAQHCGIPHFHEHLPADAQKKIDEIWKDYKEGNKCYEEQDKTHDVIEALSKEAKKNVHKRPPLPFLKNLPNETLAKFENMLHDNKIPAEEKAGRLNTLAEKELTGENLKTFREFKAKREKDDKAFKELESKLSAPARKAYEKIEEMNKEKFEILGHLSESQKEELFHLWKSRQFICSSQFVCF